MTNSIPEIPQAECPRNQLNYRNPLGTRPLSIIIFMGCVQTTRACRDIVDQISSKAVGTGTLNLYGSSNFGLITHDKTI